MTPDGLSTLPNVFQRLMLQWEGFAPYNAGQYMTLAGVYPPTTLATAWRETVIALGLQQIGQHPEAPLSSAPLLLGARPGVEAGLESARNLSPSETIRSFVTNELNRPFAPGDSPLRPFAIGEGPVTHVGMIYRHVVADSASIRLIMHAWFDRLHGGSIAGHVGLARELGERQPLWRMLQIATRELARMSRVKRVRRLPANHANPAARVVWRRLELPAGLIDRALAYARRRGVKLNDVFLAAAALACDSHVPCEASTSRRDLGLGTIVDTRPKGRPADRFFGLSLGFLQTFWRPQDLRSWDTTLRAAAQASRLARERGEANASLLRLAFAERYGRRLSKADLSDFYRKRCPLAAGISNVNLNRDWPARHHPSPLVSYTRVSPLGPMLPLVFTPTTIGQTANLGVTYRASVLGEGGADATIAAFVERLSALA